MASDYCRVRGTQLVEPSSDNETVLGSRRKPIDGRKKRITGDIERSSKWFIFLGDLLLGVYFRKFSR